MAGEIYFTGVIFFSSNHASLSTIPLRESIIADEKILLKRNSFDCKTLHKTHEVTRNITHKVTHARVCRRTGLRFSRVV